MSSELIETPTSENAFISATSPVSTTLIPTSTVTPSKTQSVPLINQPQTLTTTLQNSQENSSLLLVIMCPEDQVVPFEDLEISSSYSLLVLPSDAKLNLSTPAAPLIFLPGNPTPGVIDGSHLNGLWSYSQASPNNAWVFFYTSDNDEQHKTVWISSISGQEQWPVTNIDKKNYVRWKSDQEIYIIGHPNAEDYEELSTLDYFPFLSINVFTMEQQSLPYLVDYWKGRIADGYLISQEKSLMLYDESSIDGMMYFLYDLNNDETYPVFQWLLNEKVDPLRVVFTYKPVWIYDKDKFAITLAQQDGIDLVVDLDIETAKEDVDYDNVMTSIILPERLNPAYVLDIVPGTSQVALKRFDIYHASSPKWFYLINYEDRILIDYCFDLVDSVSDIKFSPNGRFAAISLQKFSASSEQIEFYTVVIDLKIGTAAYLEDYVVIDWGVISGSD